MKDDGTLFIAKRKDGIMAIFIDDETVTYRIEFEEKVKRNWFGIKKGTREFNIRDVKKHIKKK